MRRVLLTTCALLVTACPHFDEKGGWFACGPGEDCCHNGVKNAGETDVDCGGSACPACARGRACVLDSDCAGGACLQGACGSRPVFQAPLDAQHPEVFKPTRVAVVLQDEVPDTISIAGPAWASLEQPTANGATLVLAPADLVAATATLTAVNASGGQAVLEVPLQPVCSSPPCRAPTCANGTKDGTESDVDCGGQFCDGCVDGSACGGGGDCRSNACLNGRCAASTCTDQTQNGDETDADCGGTVCKACGTGLKCALDRDCASGICSQLSCAAPGCADGRKNGDETDVDCGGACAAAVPPLRCADRKGCLADGDCLSQDCDLANHLCQSLCTDSKKNGQETDVDCGGNCPACGDLKHCTSSTDCVSQVCNNGLCQSAGCSDGLKNGQETDTDCGGGGCPVCGDGRGCVVAGDCQSGVCTLLTCQVPTCLDTVRNGTEGDVDCGRDCPQPCADGKTCNFAEDCLSQVCGSGLCSAPSCADGLKNGDETDLDCGGSCSTSASKACADGKACKVGPDCISLVCTGLACQPATCSDGVQNEGETDTDCGGPACPGTCTVGKKCTAGADCQTHACQGGLCVNGSCNDGAKNNLETDVDCGGGTCSACADGKACKVATDCSSRHCVSLVCAVPACNDGIKNGAEGDIDCGGTCTTKCAVGKSCQLAADCASSVCTGGVCIAPTCTDHVKNGTETDVDCGGSCSFPCKDGRGCAVATDCYSGVCTAGKCVSACANPAAVEYLGRGLVGCPGHKTFALRAQQCAAGTTPCVATQVVNRTLGGAPVSIYWVDEQMHKSKTTPCQAVYDPDTLIHTYCPATSPMHFCRGTSDAYGNTCANIGCSLEIGGVLGTPMGGSCSSTTEYAGTLCCANSAEYCAPTSNEVEKFNSYMAGCKGKDDQGTAFAGACATNCFLCSPLDWVCSSSGKAPHHHYWTKSTLYHTGSSSSCAVSTAGSTVCTAQDIYGDWYNVSMRVCAQATSDTSGNTCTWENCGWKTTTPNHYFGGCPANPPAAGDKTAGALCCCPWLH